MKDIYSFITDEKNAYNKPITLEDGWDWSLKQHLRVSYLYHNSQFEEKNEDRSLRPNKNIVLPIINIQLRVMDFDVKDILLYVNNEDLYYKSLILKKYHDRWALENFIDTFIDKLIFSYTLYGGALIRKTIKSSPEVIDLKTLVFANQKNILSNPFCILHSYSFVDLKGAAKEKKWGKTSSGATIDIDTLIELVKKEGKKEVEIYEVHGELPKKWINDNTLEAEDDEEDAPQIQVVAFYKKDNGQEQGVTLFKSREPELPFKFLSRDEVEGRAVGRGGVEELFEAQVWTNWDEIKVTEMLDAASKTLHYSDDMQFKQSNDLSAAKNNQVFYLQEGKQISQIDTFPRNLNAFNDSIDRWQAQGQLLGAAASPLIGDKPSAGTPFKLFEAQQIEGKDLHFYRRGKVATFLDEVYRDWILPHIAKEITEEDDFLSELSTEELQEVTKNFVANEANKLVKARILSGQIAISGEIEEFENVIRNEFLGRGSKKFIKIFKDEFKDVEFEVMTNIKGKQKDLSLLTDKLVNVLRQYLAAPQIRQDPDMNKLLNKILESSGLSPITFNPSPSLIGGQEQIAQSQAQTLPPNQAQVATL